jgi:hypothetical protein
VIELYPGSLPHAVVGVGLAIASAHRLVNALAESRNRFAFAEVVGEFAVPRGLFAPQPGTAGDPDKSAADFALAGERRRLQRDTLS